MAKTENYKIQKTGACLAVLLAFLLVFNSAYAGLIPDLISDQTPNFTSLPAANTVNITSWIGILGVALAMAVFLTGLAYMAGSFFDSPKIMAWAKEYLFQIFASAIIAVGFVILILITPSITHATFCEPSDPAYCDHIYKAKEYSVVVQQTMVANFISLNIFNIVLSVYGTLQINIRPGGFGLSFSIAPLFRPIMDGMGLIMNFLTASWGEWTAQVYLLVFIEKQMLPILLPLGVITRAVLSRNGGNAILAIVFGLYFVFPICLIGNKAIADAHYGAYVTDGMANCQFTGSTACLYNIQLKETIMEVITSFGVVAGGAGATGLAVYLVGMKAYGLLALAAPLFSSIVLVALGMALYSFINQLAYIILILSLLLPIFNLFIVMTSIREMAKFLGTDLNISALLRLI